MSEGMETVRVGYAEDPQGHEAWDPLGTGVALEALGTSGSRRQSSGGEYSFPVGSRTTKPASDLDGSF